MSIKPVCSRCGKELKEFGGLLFSPPEDDDMVKKWHLCKSCCEIITDDLE
jgi:hypothetical protein